MFRDRCVRAQCMKFDFGLEAQWSQNNKRLQDIIKLNPLSTVRAYPGLSHALSECVKGLVRLFPHRKSFAVVKGSGPFYEDLVDYLSMEGMSRIELTVKDLTEPGECLKKIPKDCLFVLASYDDPMTGEIFPIEGLYPVLHQNRTFTVILSHSYHQVRGFPVVNQYMAVVAKIPKQGALALLGQRTSKIPVLSVGPTDWFDPDRWSQGFVSGSENKDAILDFERKLPKEFVPFFDQDTPRVYDRAVIRALEFDGEACIQMLAQDLKLNLQSPGSDGNFETLSLCRWNGVNTFNWYLDQSRRLADLRGVFMIDQSLVNADTTRALGSIGRTLHELQG